MLASSPAMVPCPSSLARQAILCCSAGHQRCRLLLPLCWVSQPHKAPRAACYSLHASTGHAGTEQEDPEAKVINRVVVVGGGAVSDGRSLVPPSMPSPSLPCVTHYAPWHSMEYSILQLHSRNPKFSAPSS